MKKALSLLLALVMCLSLCACGAPKTFDKAVEKAEEKLEKWDSQNYNGYSYSSTYPESEKTFSVIMIPTLDDAHMYSKFVAEAAAEEVYKDISKIFSKLDTEVYILLSSSDGILTFSADDFD